MARPSKLTGRIVFISDQDQTNGEIYCFLSGRQAEKEFFEGPDD